MKIHNIYFSGEIRKISGILGWKKKSYLELCDTSWDKHLKYSRLILKQLNLNIIIKILKYFSFLIVFPLEKQVLIFLTELSFMKAYTRCQALFSGRNKISSGVSADIPCSVPV